MKKLAVGVATARWIDEKDHVSSIKFIKECGYEALDYQINSWFRQTLDAEKLTSFFDLSLEELYEHYTPMKETAKEEGIVFSQFHAPFPMYYPDNAARTEYYLEITKKMMAIAAFLDCHSIVVHPWNGLDGGLEYTKEEEIEINLSMYRKLMPAAREYGVKICLENMYVFRMTEQGESVVLRGACSEVEETCQYIDTLNEEAGEELFGFCLDIGHAAMTGEDIYDYIKKLGKRLTDLHIHENNGRADQHMVPYSQEKIDGGGFAIDWEAFIKGLKEIDFEGALSFETVHALEVVPEELKKSLLTYISSIGKYFRNRIEQS